MSGSKSFGVRAPPDPPQIHPPYPLPSVEDDSGPPAPADDGATCDCRCPCGRPAEVAPPAGASSGAEWSVPPQLLRPFPEPPLPRRPARPGAASLGEVAASITPPHPLPLAPDAGPSLGEVATAIPARPPPPPPPPPPPVPPLSRPGPLRSLSCPPPVYRPGAMFQGGEEDDHPYIRVLNTPAPERPLLVRYFQPLSWSAMGFGSAFIFNLFAKKPPFAGIQRHIAMGVAGWVGGVYISKWIDSNSAERDAVLKHYIQLHQEDFPVPERKKFGELLQPWSPLR